MLANSPIFSFHEDFQRPCQRRRDTNTHIISNETCYCCPLEQTRKRTNFTVPWPNKTSLASRCDEITAIILTAARLNATVAAWGLWNALESWPIITAHSNCIFVRSVGILLEIKMVVKDGRGLCFELLKRRKNNCNRKLQCQVAKDLEKKLRKTSAIFICYCRCIVFCSGWFIHYTL